MAPFFGHRCRILLTLTLAGCNASLPFANGGDGATAGEAKPQDKPDARPTDGDEGSDAYLTGVDLIRMQRSTSEVLQVSGPGGAVTSPSGTLDRASVAAWSIDRTKSPDAQHGYPAKNLACGPVNADGSFALQVTLSASVKVLVVTAGVSCQAAFVPTISQSPDKTKAAVAEGDFSKFQALVAGAATDACTCAHAERYDLATGKCLPIGTSNCPTPPNLDNEVCGCDGETYLSECWVYANGVKRFTAGRCSGG